LFLFGLSHPSKVCKQSVLKTTGTEDSAKCSKYISYLCSYEQKAKIIYMMEVHGTHNKAKIMSLRVAPDSEAKKEKNGKTEGNKSERRQSQSFSITR